MHHNIKKILVLALIGILLHSCNSLGLPIRRYSYEYNNGLSENIDFSKGNWLLTPISSTSFGINEDTSYSILKKFLSSKLGSRLKISNELKDNNNKYLIPNIKFDDLKENLKYLGEFSKCDYLIGSKIYYLDDTRDIGVGSKFDKNKKLNKGYESACKISIIVYDLKTEKEIFNLDCLGYIWISHEESEKFNTYQTSKSSSADVMEKIIKKLR